MIRAAARLWDFYGGLHMPDHKAESNGSEIQSVPVPERLILPLSQHIGAPSEPCVPVGEKVLKGQLIARARGPVSANLHAPTSGVVKQIAPQPTPHPSGLDAPCIVLESDGDDRWSEDLPPPLSDYPERDPTQISERIRWAGVVGLGGATFPTSVKVQPMADRRIHTLILNGAECEPFITCDDRLMRERTGQIIDGIKILKALFRPSRCMIGTEDNKPEAIDALRQALARDTGLSDVEIKIVPTKYPSGGERQLIKLLTGKEVPSREIPARIGIVVQNVATAAAISNAVLGGKPLIHRVVTVTGGGVSRPGNYEVPLGTLARDLIDQAGGYTGRAALLIQGGPMMGVTLPHDQMPVTKGTNCYLVASEQEAPTPPPAAACIRCGQCARACPAELLPQQLYWHSRAKEFDKIQDFHLFDCIECGCCSQVCPAHIPLVQFHRFAKTSIWSKAAERRRSDQARQRHQAREARLARLAAERKAKLRKKKEALAKPAKPAKKGEGDDAQQTMIEAASERSAEQKVEEAGSETSQTSQ